MMAIENRHALARAAAPRYKRASKKEKRLILDEFCANSELTRKHAIRVLKAPPVARKKRNRIRQRTYGTPEQHALRSLWPLSGHLSARRLVAALPDLMEACERHDEALPSSEVRQKLLSMSASTCDRLLSPLRRKFPHKALSLTRPGEHLKSQIAVRLGAPWNEAEPGFLEADLVHHCGPSSQGLYLHTLTLTDVATGWTELSALASRGRIETVAGIGLASRRLPFAIKGIDTDNGSEFINYHLKTFCEQGGIEFTRSRPWVKNDGCRVEQKNGALVRKHAGYRRLEASELSDLKELYTVLGLLVNFFEPSAKLVRKLSKGGKTRKHYDKAKTPYRRLLESENFDPEAKAALTAKFLTLNPVSLRNQLRAVKKDLLEPDLVRFLDESTNHLGAILT